MTLTSPACPVGPEMLRNAATALEAVPGVTKANVSRHVPPVVSRQNVRGRPRRIGGLLDSGWQTVSRYGADPRPVTSADGSSPPLLPREKVPEGRMRGRSGTAVESQTEPSRRHHHRDRPLGLSGDPGAGCGAAPHPALRATFSRGRRSRTSADARSPPSGGGGRRADERRSRTAVESRPIPERRRHISGGNPYLSSVVSSPGRVDHRPGWGDGTGSHRHAPSR